MATMGINPEEDTSTDNGSQPQVEEFSSDSTSESDDKEKEEESKDEESKDEDDQSRDSISTVEKDCGKPTSFKPSYLNAVLKGKFNSFHIIGEHRENVMQKERINIADNISEDTFHRSGAAA